MINNETISINEIKLTFLTMFLYAENVLKLYFRFFFKIFIFLSCVVAWQDSRLTLRERDKFIFGGKTFFWRMAST